MNASATVERDSNGWWVTIGRIGEPNFVVRCESEAHAEFIVEIWTR